MINLVQKLLTRLRLKFSHLNKNEFRHGFNDTINPMCACGTEVETTDPQIRPGNHPFPPPPFPP